MPKLVIDKSVLADPGTSREVVTKLMEHWRSRAESTSGPKPILEMLETLWLSDDKSVDDRWRPIVAKYWQIISGSKINLQEHMHQTGKREMVDVVRSETLALGGGKLIPDSEAVEDRDALIEHVSDEEVADYRAGAKGKADFVMKPPDPDKPVKRGPGRPRKES